MKGRRWLILLGLVLVLVAGFAYFVSRPSHGHQVPVDVKLQPKPHASTPVPAASNTQSDYFQLNLPPGYQPQTPQTVPGLLFSQTITKPSAFGSLIITIGVKNMPEGGLGNDPSYRLRQEQTARYQLSSQTVSGDVLQIANDSVDSAVAAFWPHGSYLATISVSSGIANPGDSENSDKLKVLQVLLSAWRWR